MLHTQEIWFCKCWIRPHHNTFYFKSFYYLLLFENQCYRLIVGDKFYLYFSVLLIMWTEDYKITHQLFHEKNETAEILRNLSKDAR